MRCFFAQQEIGAMSSRVKNTASLSQVALLCKSRINVQQLQQWLVSKNNDHEEVFQSFGNFVKDLLAITERPTKKIVGQGAQNAFDFVSRTDAQAFGLAIETLVSAARSKSRSMTSGAKLSPSLKQVIGWLSLPSQISAKAVAAVQQGAEKWTPKKKKAKRLQEESPPGSFNWSQEYQQMIASRQKSSTLPSASSFEENEVVELMSSQEEKILESAVWIDYGGSSTSLDLVAKKTVGSQIVSSTSLKPGPDGFALAIWPDGSSSATELTNLQLSSGSTSAPSKPKAKAKSKAKSKAKATAKNKTKPKSKARALASVKKGYGKGKGSRPSALPDIEDQNGRTIKGCVRLSLFPGGCGKCRWRQGCTPSCWTKSN